MNATMDAFYRDYSKRLAAAVASGPADAVSRLAAALLGAVHARTQVFLAGNGGSAGNALHLANDFLYGIGKDTGIGLRVEALSANVSVVTCLANDIDYSEVFAAQIKRKASTGDILIVLSGSGNSPNVVRAIETAHEMGVRTFAVLGYSGGRCLELVQEPIHFPIDDMQIAEDLQLVVGHMCMQWVSAQLAATGQAR